MSNICIIIMMQILVMTEHLVDYSFFWFFLSFFLAMTDIFITLILVIFSQVFAHVQTHQIIHIKYVQFFIAIIPQ